jgi:hypothetical protein
MAFPFGENAAAGSAVVEREFSREVSAYSTDLQGMASEAAHQSQRLPMGHRWKIGLDQIP